MRALLLSKNKLELLSFLTDHQLEIDCLTIMVCARIDHISISFSGHGYVHWNQIRLAFSPPKTSRRNQITCDPFVDWIINRRWINQILHAILNYKTINYAKHDIGEIIPVQEWWQQSNKFVWTNISNKTTSQIYSHEKKSISEDKYERRRENRLVFFCDLSRPFKLQSVADLTIFLYSIVI